MKYFKGRIQKSVCMVLAIVLCLAVLGQQASVTEAATKTGSVTFSYELSGCTFRLYYIGTYVDSDEYELSEEFQNTAVSRTDIEEGNWFTFALTLDTIVLYAGISPIAEAQTDSNGQVKFSNLKEGIYLMTADTMTVDDTTYKVTPMIVQMPCYYSDGTFEYNSSIEISKYDTEVKQEYTDVSVQKVWDDDNSSSRPESVTVYLLRGSDGEVYEEVTLSAENNWRYTWSNLDASYDWRVAEQDMTEYGVSYSYSNGVIVITNQQGSGKTHNPGHSEGEDSETWYEESESSTTEDTETETEGGSGENYENGDTEDDLFYDEDSEDMIYEDLSEDTELEELSEDENDDDEDDDSEPGTSESGKNDSGKDDSGSGSSSSKLPQTGLDWGPAAYLVLAAAICFLIGIIRGRSSNKEDSK